MPRAAHLRSGARRDHRRRRRALRPPRRSRPGRRGRAGGPHAAAGWGRQGVRTRPRAARRSRRSRALPRRRHSCTALIRAADPGVRSFVTPGTLLAHPQSKKMALRRLETANLQVFHGRGWVRTSDLSRVRRSTSGRKSSRFAGGNRQRTFRPSPSGHHEFQEIPGDLGQRPTSLARKGGPPGPPNYRGRACARREEFFSAVRHRGSLREARWPPGCRRPPVGAC
jgi:hypothetical protein